MEQLAVTGLMVVHQGDHLQQIKQLLEPFALVGLSEVVNGAVVAIVLPRALQIVEGFPAAEPFGALVVLNA